MVVDDVHSILKIDVMNVVKQDTMLMTAQDIEVKEAEDTPGHEAGLGLVVGEAIPAVGHQAVIVVEVEVGTEAVTDMEEAVHHQDHDLGVHQGMEIKISHQLPHSPIIIVFHIISTLLHSIVNNYCYC